MLNVRAGAVETRGEGSELGSDLFTPCTRPHSAAVTLLCCISRLVRLFSALTACPRLHSPLPVSCPVLSCLLACLRATLTRLHTEIA